MHGQKTIKLNVLRVTKLYSKEVALEDSDLLGFHND
jgi:hypothetical protein